MNRDITSNPRALERYAFLWSEARLVTAAISMLIGGFPVILTIAPLAPVRAGLTLSWIVSGVASAYLIYRWNEHKTLFGKKNPRDTVAFFASTISGLNLGFTGLAGTNIAMAIFANKLLFSLTGLAYLAVAGYLFQRWKGSEEKLF